MYFEITTCWEYQETTKGELKNSNFDTTIKSGASVAQQETAGGSRVSLTSHQQSSVPNSTEQQQVVYYDFNEELICRRHRRLLLLFTETVRKVGGMERERCNTRRQREVLASPRVERALEVWMIVVGQTSAALILNNSLSAGISCRAIGLLSIPVPRFFLYRSVGVFVQR